MRTRFIEYDLPRAEVSEASAREKSIRHGHPSTRIYPIRDLVNQVNQYLFDDGWQALAEAGAGPNGPIQ